MAVQRHSLFQNNLIDVIINSETWASAQQSLVVKVGFIMLTFGKPTWRSHFWTRSSSSVFLTALSPSKHASYISRWETEMYRARQTNRANMLENPLAAHLASSRAINFGSGLPSHLIRSAQRHDACGKALKIKVRTISINPQAKRWTEASGGRTFCSLIYSAETHQYSKAFDLLPSCDMNHIPSSGN